MKGNRAAFKKEQTRLGKRRPGVGLAFVLVITIVGGALIALIFEATSRYMNLTTFERRPYENAIELSGYIDQTKGYIVSENKRREAQGISVLHGQGNPNASFDAEILKSLNDLQVLFTVTGSGDVLNRDVDLGQVMGQRQRLELRTYDANYKTTQIASTPPTVMPSADIANLPPSLYPWDQVHAYVDGGIVGASEEEADPIIYKRYGGYMIRARLFNVDDPDHPLLLKDIEEVFTQVIE